MPIEAGTVAEAIIQFNGESPAAVLLDIDLPDGSGLDVLRQIKQEQPESIVIMITGNVQVDNTISALRGGAYDFIWQADKSGRTPGHYPQRNRSSSFAA